MKILCLADLHIVTIAEDSTSFQRARAVVEKEKPELILIAGDVFDYVPKSPYEELSKLAEVPIVCCLGNHEFSYSGVEETLDYYKRTYEPGKYDVHYLDIVGSKTIGNINIVGNVLWYDGSLYPYGSMPCRVSKDWLDSTILHFDWRRENERCVEKIKNGIRTELTNVLLTHCVPHSKLNTHYATSKVNGYVGMADLFGELGKGAVQWAVCGHTHRYCTAEIDGVFCVNVGNDYAFNEDELKYFIIESEE